MVDYNNIIIIIKQIVFLQRKREIFIQKKNPDLNAL